MGMRFPSRIHVESMFLSMDGCAAWKHFRVFFQDVISRGAIAKKAIIFAIAWSAHVNVTCFMEVDLRKISGNFSKIYSRHSMPKSWKKTR